MERIITPKQIAKLHTLLAQSGMMEQKRQLVWEASNGRTTTSKDLTHEEVTVLMNFLEELLGLDKMRRKIFALAYQAGIIYGDSPEDKKMNVAKLNQFLSDRGAVKKPLNKMDKSELLKVVNQFASIVKHNTEADHNKNVKSLLNELNLKVK